MNEAAWSVAEAARVLGVHPQRIHQRIRNGSLPAEKVGRQWVLSPAEVRRIAGSSSPGRPPSTKTVWDMVAVQDEKHAAALSTTDRSRARSRLRNLMTHVATADTNAAATVLARTLGNRAQRALYAASPIDLPDLIDDAHVYPSGASLAESNIAAADIAEGYVRSASLPDLVEHYLLSPASRTRANVVLHVVDSDVARPELNDLDTLARSPLLRAADLAEHDGIRERIAAVQAVSALSGDFGTSPSSSAAVHG